MFEDFKKPTRQDWEDKAKVDLKGNDPYTTYNWINGSLELSPYYDETDIGKIANVELSHNRLLVNEDPSGEPRVWKNLERIDVKKVAEANKKALHALLNGADGISFDYTNCADSDFEALLKDIKPEYCYLSFCNISFTQAEELVVYLKEDSNHSNFQGTISLKELDPEHSFKLISTNASFNSFCFLTVEVSDNEEGCIQIGSAIYECHKLLRSAALRGMDINTVARALSITTYISTDYFGEIAKIRALRNLYFQLAQSYGANIFQPEDLTIHCISKPWLAEAYEPHANMLKSSTAGMAAILGGCNTLSIMPENSEDKMQQRIARNVSSILKEEAFLSKTSDPVAGSYYLESLTDQLAQKGWEYFQNQTEKDEA